MTHPQCYHYHNEWLCHYILRAVNSTGQLFKEIPQEADPEHGNFRLHAASNDDTCYFGHCATQVVCSLVFIVLYKVQRGLFLIKHTSIFSEG